MDDNLLMVGVGILMSLVAAYAPGVKDKYDALTSPQKAGVMIILSGLVAVVVYLASCHTVWQWVECSDTGIQQLIEMWVAGWLANVGAYVSVVKPRKGPPAGAT